MLAGDNAVSLTNLKLSLRRNSKSGCCAAKERHQCAAVSQARQKAIISPEITGIYFFGSFFSALFHVCLLVFGVFKDFLQFSFLAIENFLNL